MPKVTRKRVSVFESSAVRWGGALVGIGGVIMLAAIFFGMADKGAIDVSGKINATDQTGFASQVNPMSGNAGEANGGLRPAPTNPEAERAPEVMPEVTEQASENASTTDEVVAEASTTPEVAPEEVANDGLTPSD